jgi:hypothetical protein
VGSDKVGSNNGVSKGRSDYKAKSNESDVPPNLLF